LKLDIRKLAKDDLDQYFIDQKLPKYRSDQVWQWLWKKQKFSFEDMRNIPKTILEKLEADFRINAIDVDKRQVSIDGTIKNRIQLHDGHLVESVLIPVEDMSRYTACVSSQVGCSLTCKFCATGKMKLQRNLEASEIFDQVALLNQQCIANYDKPLSNIVYMGMGEPLLNYKNVLKSIHYITNDVGLGMSPKRITVSTVGIAKMIKRLADECVKFNLALSLHAADDHKRSQIMPINDQNNLSTLMESIKYFYEVTKNRISFEYISFKGFNDTPTDAKNLIELCRHFPVKVNIIEYNPIDGVNFERSTSVSIDQFAQILRNHKIMVTVRKSRGMDIDAACGQLANKG